MVANRLKKEFDNQHILSRVGGDEFVVIISEILEQNQDLDIISKMIKSLDAPFKVVGRTLHTSACAGAAKFPEDGSDVISLLKFSEIAMFEAKKSGRNKVIFYNQALKKQSESRHKLKEALHKAIRDDEFVLFYQPQISLSTGKVIGAEALIRWHSNDGSIISPADFIPVAEDSGLILPIGDIVLNRACEQINEWKKNGLNHLKMSVNISALQFRQEDFPSKISEALKKFDISPRLLEIEITESSVMGNIGQVLKTLNRFKEEGISLAIDDFGTGYSSFSYLHQFPIDILKIDQSFVRKIDSKEGKAIVSAIVSIAKSLSLGVVAEGVETQYQLDYMKMLGCDTIQGYYYSKPLEANTFMDFCKS